MQGYIHSTRRPRTLQEQDLVKREIESEHGMIVYTLMEFRRVEVGGCLTVYWVVGFGSCKLAVQKLAGKS